MKKAILATVLSLYALKAHAWVPIPYGDAARIFGHMMANDACEAGECAAKIQTLQGLELVRCFNNGAQCFAASSVGMERIFQQGQADIRQCLETNTAAFCNAPSPPNIDADRSFCAQALAHVNTEGARRLSGDEDVRDFRSVERYMRGVNERGAALPARDRGRFVNWSDRCALVPFSLAEGRAGGRQSYMDEISRAIAHFRDTPIDPAILQRQQQQAAGEHLAVCNRYVERARAAITQNRTNPFSTPGNYINGLVSSNTLVTASRALGRHPEFSNQYCRAYISSNILGAHQTEMQNLQNQMVNRSRALGAPDVRPHCDNWQAGLLFAIDPYATQVRSLNVLGGTTINRGSFNSEQIRADIRANITCEQIIRCERQQMLRAFRIITGRTCPLTGAAPQPPPPPAPDPAPPAAPAAQSQTQVIRQGPLHTPEELAIRQCGDRQNYITNVNVQNQPTRWFECRGQGNPPVLLETDSPRVRDHRCSRFLSQNRIIGAEAGAARDACRDRPNDLDTILNRMCSNSGLAQEVRRTECGNHPATQFTNGAFRIQGGQVVAVTGAGAGATTETTARRGRQQAPAQQAQPQQPATPPSDNCPVQRWISARMADAIPVCEAAGFNVRRVPGNNKFWECACP